MKFESFGNNDNLERYILNNPDQKKDEIVEKYREMYLKAWGDPKNTYEENVFLQEEAFRAAKSDPDLIAAYKQAMIKFYEKEKQKEQEKNNELAIMKLKNISHKNDHSKTFINNDGMIVSEEDMLGNGEKQ